MGEIHRGSRWGRKAAVAGAHHRKERRDETEAQRVERLQLQATLAFVKAAHADTMLYLDMEEVAKLYPPPKHIMEKISEYTKYLEEDEDDFRIGLCQLIEVKSDFEKSF
ncbi:hypothetical protein VPH35_058982 [Triticum aestivum]